MAVVVQERAPIVAIHSRAESLEQPQKAAVHSSAPRRRSPRGPREDAKHLFEQVSRDQGPVTGCRANVVNRSALTCQNPPSLGNRGSIRRRPQQYLFCPQKTQRSRCHAPHPDADFLDTALSKAAGCRDANLRNGLGVARSHFTPVAKRPLEPLGQNDRSDQLVRSECRFLVSKMKLFIRDAPRPPYRSQLQLGGISKQGRRRIGCRRSIRKISADRSAILICDAPRPRGALGKQRKMLLDTRVVAYLGESAASANRDAISIFDDLTAVQAAICSPVFAPPSLPAPKSTMISVPPAIGVHWPGLIMKQLQHGIQVSRSDQIIVGRIRPHLDRSRIGARSLFCSRKDAHVAGTAAKIAVKPLLNLVLRGVGMLFEQDATSPESSPACRCRTVLHRTREKPAAPDSASPVRTRLRS